MSMLKSNATAGARVYIDAGFECMNDEAQEVELFEDDHGVYWECARGHHYIDGQVDFVDEMKLVGMFDNKHEHDKVLGAGLIL